MEFQAIVLAAGRGSRLTDITSTVPKCLLPVGNVPLINYCLHALKSLRVQEMIIIVLENEKAKIQEVIDTADINTEIIGIPSNEDWGTADSLRHIKDKIKHDVIVISCDLVTDFDLNAMANLHRKHDSWLTVLLAPWPNNFKDVTVPGRKGKHKQEKDIIGLDDMGRLMFFNSEADLEGGVPMKVSLLGRHPVINVFSNLMDAHIYMIKKELVSFIASNENISTLKGEFLPAIISKQFSKKQGLQKCLTDVTLPDTDASQKYDVEDLHQLALQLSSWHDYPGSLQEKYSGDKMRCFAHIERESFCLRINSLVAYSEINRQIAKHIKGVLGKEPKSSEFPKHQVDGDSILGDNCELLAKSSIKQSVIGHHCSLGEKVKISNSVIMDNVSIQSSSSVQGTIICNNARIGSNCELKNCVIGPGQEIEDSSKLGNEVIQGACQLMEI